MTGRCCPKAASREALEFPVLRALLACHRSVSHISFHIVELFVLHLQKYKKLRRKERQKVTLTKKLINRNC